MNGTTITTIVAVAISIASVLAVFGATFFRAKTTVDDTAAKDAIKNWRELAESRLEQVALRDVQVRELTENVHKLTFKIEALEKRIDELMRFNEMASTVAAELAAATRQAAIELAAITKQTAADLANVLALQESVIAAKATKTAAELANVTVQTAADLERARIARDTKTP